MFPVGGEKKRCVKMAQVKFNGTGGVRILCFCKYVNVVLTCVCGFLCIPLRYIDSP